MKPIKAYLTLFTLTMMMFCIASLTFADAKDKIVKSYKLTSNGRVTLQNVSGDIEIKSGGGDQVKITARHAGGANHDLNDVVHITQTSGDIRIDTRSAKTLGIFRSRTSVRYELLIPDSAHVKIETTSGNVDVKNIGGGLDVETVSGDIKVMTVKKGIRSKTISGDIYLKDILGSTDVKTTSGDIRIHDVNGSLEAESVSGDIDLKNIDGKVDLKTTSGDLSIAGLKGSIEAESVSGDIDQKSHSEINEIEMETISGKISAQGIFVPNGSYTLGSHSGNINLAIPSESNVDLQANTSSGDIDCEFVLNGYVHMDNKRLRGTIGKGGANLSVSTFSGDIRINKY